MSSHSMNRPAPISLFSDQRRTKSTIWSRVSCGTQTPVRAPQAFFLGPHARPSVRPKPRPWSGSSSPGTRFAPGRLSGSVAPSARRQRAVLEELFLPAVKDRGLQAEFVTELRDRFLLQQMPPQDGDLLFRLVVLPFLLHAFSPLPYWENAVSISS